MKVARARRAEWHCMLTAIGFIVMWVAAKEPPDRENQTLREHVACLFEKDGWSFSLIYVVTFGGFERRYEARIDPVRLANQGVQKAGRR